MNVYLHGTGLICGLADSLPLAVERIRDSEIGPNPVELPDGSTRPYYTIGGTKIDWQSQLYDCVQKAVEQAGLAQRRDIPLIIASSCININQIETCEGNPESCWDFAEHIRTCLSWRAKIYLVPVACTASLQAIILAKQMIQTGFASDVLVLGIELFSRSTFSGFASMQLLASQSAQPLGAYRDGMVLGEAVAAWHLSSDFARWQLLGGSSIVSGADTTGASPEVVAQLCQQLLSNTSIAASEIGLIKIQASGSPQNDVHEIEGLQKTFHPMPALTTLKHLVGHTLGASGMVETMLLMACLEQKININHSYALEPKFAQLLVSTLPKTRYLMSVILGFAGEHAAILFKDNGVTDEPENLAD